LVKQVIYDLSVKAKEAEKTGVPLKVIGAGEESRDFIHVKDVCRAIELVLKKGSDSGVFNVASGEEVSISTIAETLLEICPQIPGIEYSQKTRRGDPKNWKADISKLKAIGFNPSISLKEGIKEVLESS
jgi:nucleoside-diphosphate-sugar epimerase